MASTDERMGNWAAAAASFDAALARHDSKAEWHFRLGRAHERLRNWEAAAASYQAATARQDGEVDWTLARFKLALRLKTKRSSNTS